jgi:hypothetical protein
VDAMRWVRVTANSPCPICHKGDWCRVTSDGCLAGCMRIEIGCFRTKEGRDGSRVYLHRLGDATRPRVDPPAPSGPEAKRAEADTLHDVYSALLGNLKLSDSHLENLKERGLTDKAIVHNGYRTLPVQGRPRIVRKLHEHFNDKLLHVPGFVVKESRSGRYLTLRGPAGLIVPCRDQAGRIVALKVRRDDMAEGGRRYIYCSSAGYGGPGPGAPVHFPLGMPEVTELVRLTEGELKADLIQAQTDLPTVSIPGVGSWRPALAMLKALGCKAVRLAFDADAWDNFTVARALSNSAKALAEAGFAVEMERWDQADGKGLDDLLAVGKAPELLQGEAALQAVRDILAEASAGEEPEPPDELARLQSLLAIGGAAALFRDKAMMQALADLADADPAGFAAVRASIRERVSLRELDRALRPFRRQAIPATVEYLPNYFEQNGCICHNVRMKEGSVPVALCNFTARIVEEVIHDDGAEQMRSLAMQGTLADGSALPRADVPAGDFAGMGWIVPAWGTRAVVYAGTGKKDHLRAALQLLSGDVPRRTVFQHMGWRKIGAASVYLHGGGVIGAEELIKDIPVLLPEPLAGFRFPSLLGGRELAEAVRASLGLLRLGPDQLTFPLLAAVYRAVLGDTDFALHLAGPTGSFKTEAAALAQQHYGAGMDARNLPANWSSTGNALEALAFIAKDALLVIDDFCPTGSTADVQRYHKEADRLFRGQGNRAGRQRMRADASLRPPKPPRGLLVSTGEDVPHGQSLRARLLVLEVSPGDFGPQPPDSNPTLTACQRDAAGGEYAASLAGFLRWLAPQYDAVRVRLRTEAAELSDRARADRQHARTPGIVADLALGLRYLLDFARFVGAINDRERTELWQRGWDALAEGAAAQAAHITNAEPAGLFLRLLWAAVASGYAHIADEQGNAPCEPHRWGWRSEGDMSKPQGLRAGWLAAGEIYLEPDASYAAVQRLARDQNESFAISAHTLRRRLKDKELLATTDTSRGKLTVRKTLQGSRRDVLHIVCTGGPSALIGGPIGPEREAAGGNGPETWAGPWAENGQANGEPAHKMATTDTSGPSPTAHRQEMGQLGRSSAGGDFLVRENPNPSLNSEWDEV